MDFSTSTYKALKARAVDAARKAGAPAAQLDDIAQEAMLRLWAKDSEPDNPNAWIRAVARNLAIDAHRGDAPGGWTDMPLSAPGPGEKPWPTAFHEPSPSALGRARHAWDSVARAMDEVLTPVEKLLLLGSAQGISVKEIAASHGYTEKSARQKISVARKKLREAFPDRDLDF